MINGFELGFDILLTAAALIYFGRLILESRGFHDYYTGYTRCVEKRSLLNQNIAKRKCC